MTTPGRGSKVKKAMKIHRLMQVILVTGCVCVGVPAFARGRLPVSSHPHSAAVFTPAVSSAAVSSAALSRLSSGTAYYQDQALVMAGTLMATLPLIVVVVIFGRQLISGIMDGAVKA